MTKAYDRRYFAFLFFLFFLSFLGFHGTQDYPHLAALSAPASIASLASLVFVPRSANKIPERYRLNDHRDILRALAGKI